MRLHFLEAFDIRAATAPSPQQVAGWQKLYQATKAGDAFPDAGLAVLSNYMVVDGIADRIAIHDKRMDGFVGFKPVRWKFYQFVHAIGRTANMDNSTACILFNALHNGGRLSPYGQMRSLTMQETDFCPTLERFKYCARVSEGSARSERSLILEALRLMGAIETTKGAKQPDLVLTDDFKKMLTDLF